MAADREVLRHTFDTQAMEPADRDGLLGCLASLIESGYGGRITKRYMFELRVARRAGGRRAGDAQ